MKAVHLVLLIAVTAVSSCAPHRDPVGGDVPTGTQLQSAFFTTVKLSAEADSGALVLVDADYSCEELGSFGELDQWQMAPGVEWVQLSLLLGNALLSWQTEFISEAAWQSDCEEDDCWNYESAAIFAGAVGLGPSGDDDDDEVIVGRDVTGYPGEHLDDILVITSYSESMVTGYLQSAAGDYAFHAIHCGDRAGDDFGDDDDDVIDPPGEPVDQPLG